MTLPSHLLKLKWKLSERRKLKICGLKAWLGEGTWSRQGAAGTTCRDGLATGPCILNAWLKADT